MIRARIAVAVLAVAALAVPSFAVTTSHWVHTTEADFKTGSFRNVVATNLGDLKLSRAVKTLLEQDPKVSVVYSIVETPDHTIYAGTGPQGALLQIKDDKVSTVLSLEEGVNILSLLVDRDGSLLIGTGGDQARILRLAKNSTKPTEIFKVDGVQYIYAMAQTPDGVVYAATGPNGQLFAINPDGTNSVIVKTNEANLVSMVSDGKDLLYVGTDPNGLVYRINRKTKQAFVLFDAPESEISTLALDGNGNLYAATAEESPSDTNDLNVASDKQGRPESGNAGVPLPQPKPQMPKEPSPPESNQPNRIPRISMPGDQQAHVYLLMADEDPQEPANPNPPADVNMPAHKPTTQPSHPPMPNEGAAAAPKAEGNAIYRIDPDGFVNEVFRQPVQIFSMIERNGVLLVGTGPEGLIYQINPQADENLVVARVDPKEITALLPTSDGRILLGMSNTGGIAAMSAGFADHGTYTSAVLDANQVSRFGNMHLDGLLPKTTKLTVATRSGNVQDPTDPGWSPWSNETPAAEFVPVPSPSARYLQYRLTFATETPKATPIVEDIDVAYQTPNLPPVVKSVKIADAQPAQGQPDQPQNNPAAKPPTSDHRRTITWEASDPNSDTLLYSLYFRNDVRAPWILLKDKLKDATFDWDTRSVADGRYEIKVVASDASSNPRGGGKVAARVSDPVVVDNTPPAIGDVNTAVSGQQVKVSLRIVDRTSTVASARYTVDSQDDWQMVLPSDNIFDSSAETVNLTTPALKPGDHQITISATDSHGNEAFETILVNVPAPVAVK